MPKVGPSRKRSTSRQRARSTTRAGSRNANGTAFTKSVTTGPGAVVARIMLRQTINETSTFGTVERKDFEFAQNDFPSIKKYSQVKIHRVGVAVLPRSYIEFTVLGVTWASIDTRQELINMPDCEHIWSYQGGPTIRWYTPNEGVYKSWQDLPTSATKILSGLHIEYTGLNDLQATTGGLLAGIWYDVSLRGINTSTAASVTVAEATTAQLTSRLRDLHLSANVHPGLSNVSEEAAGTDDGWSIWSRRPPHTPK